MALLVKEFVEINFERKIIIIIIIVIIIIIILFFYFFGLYTKHV